jgi:uncharacterized OsmC-like protein
MSESATEVPAAELIQQEAFLYEIRFDPSLPALQSDEHPPLGGGKGPSPLQLLAAATGNCLSDSLYFALRKFKQDPSPIHTRVYPTVGRNPAGRLRVLGMRVEIAIGVPGAGLQHLDRALAQFEDFCTVASSISPSVPIDIRITDSAGTRLR